MPDTYTDSELEELALSSYRRRRTKCPRCNARVHVSRMELCGRATTPLMLRCMRCGANGQFSPDHLEEMELEWTRDQKVRIVESYWASNHARCPCDEAVLDTIKSNTVGVWPPEVKFTCPYCGRSLSSREVQPENDPERFEGKYEIVRPLGEGGMGTVSLARDREDSSLWAAKKIRPEFIRNAEAVRRFKREGRIVGAVSHVNILAIREVFVDESGGTLVMPYLDGGNLTSAISSQDVSAKALARYFSDVVAGVTHLHQAGVVHRDLKPDNVLIDSTSDSAQISDFGLARLLERDSTILTAENGGLGTPRYAAPELLEEARDAGPAADIYALGLIAYEIATRRSPYDIPIRFDQLPPALAVSIESALKVDPAERPENGRLLQAALANALDQIR